MKDRSKKGKTNVASPNMEKGKKKKGGTGNRPAASCRGGGGKAKSGVSPLEKRGEKEGGAESILSPREEKRVLIPFHPHVEKGKKERKKKGRRGGKKGLS